MIQVKTFTQSTANKIEKAFNEWARINPNIEVKHVKYHNGVLLVFYKLPS